MKAAVGARRGDWIQTYTGLQFWPLDPRPDEIRIHDIAHALSMLCRFNGHCREFYSVAEHSVLVSTVVPPADRGWGLLHDAAEAYLSDVARPIKPHLPQFKVMEEGLLAVIAQRFGLNPERPATVTTADNLLLSTEKLALMGPEPASWGGLPPPLDPGMVRALPPAAAETEFLRRFGELFPGMGDERF